MKFSHFFYLCLLALFSFSITSCEGGRCAATDSALDDVDADCISDGSDNCPTIANPEQIDADSDGSGASCDTDDADDAVALIRSLVASDLSQDERNAWQGQYSLVSSDCESPISQIEIIEDADLSLQWADGSQSLSPVILASPLRGLATTDGEIILASDSNLIKVIDLNSDCESYYE